MRRPGRCRPAGSSQVPEPPSVLGPARPDELCVWRRGPDHEVWDLTAPAVTTVASIWLAGAAPVWCRAVWPQTTDGAPLAPLDLSVGHVLELCTHRPGTVTVRYACVLNVASDAIVAFVTSDCDRARQASILTDSAWRDARLNDAWEQIGRPSRSQS